VIVALDAAELLTMTEMQRAEHAAMVRDRLTDLREELGIRFPVYVVVTKMDLLRGFNEYFQSLTSEGRTQAWGFTLAPSWHEERARPGRARALRTQVEAELALLKDRLAAGLRARLNEEFDVDRRKRLFALPQELAGLAVPLVPMLDEIFPGLAFRQDAGARHAAGRVFHERRKPTSEVPADRARCFSGCSAAWAFRQRGTRRPRYGARAQGTAGLLSPGRADQGGHFRSPSREAELALGIPLPAAAPLGARAVHRDLFSGWPARWR
jgi:type VI secretion system protein ImpL